MSPAHTSHAISETLTVERSSATQQAIAAHIRRQRIRSVPQVAKSRPLFHWDATRHLPPHALDEHRSRFPQFQGLAPQVTELPDAGTWAANLAIGITEVMLHQRPVAQLERWVVPGLFQAFAQAHRELKVTVTRRPPLKVASYRTCAISERIVETCVILDLDGLRRTISLRLEGHRGRWIATALQIL